MNYVTSLNITQIGRITMQVFDIIGIIKKPIRKKCLLVLALLLILPHKNTIMASGIKTVKRGISNVVGKGRCAALYRAASDGPQG